jgi:quercetin dioxygenase-like cupin family protein
VNYTLLDRDDLPYQGNAYEFQGAYHFDTDVSFIRVDMPPGSTIRSHNHPYKEISIIQEGVSTFTVRSARLEARAGQIIIVPAEAPHKFANLSDRQLKQIDIHVSKQFITQWLED